MMMKRVEATSRFGWIMSLLSAAFVGGLFLDGWAHTHGLVVTGPLRAALSRDEPAPVGWSGQLPMVLSVTSVLSVITFFMSLGHPLSNVPADATRFALVRAQATGWIDLLQSAGVQGMLAWMAVLMAAVFFLLGRRHAPTGSLTF